MAGHNQHAAKSLDDSTVVDQIEAYREAIVNGQPADRGQLLRQFPEIADQLNACLDAVEMVGRLAAQFRDVLPAACGDELGGQSSANRLLGDFQLGQEIGRGGMGVVYEAEQVSLRRRVAVKVLPFAALWPATAIERFRGEVRIAAQLEHPHIVPIYAVGCEQGVHFYAMKLIAGCSLAELVPYRQRGGMGEKEERDIRDPKDLKDEGRIAAIAAAVRGDGDGFRAAARLAQHAAQALAFAHQQGVIHRDIKPSNLLLDGDGHLFVADFGLARFESDANLTRTGDLLGTPRYMSPEQAAGDSKQIDHRSDIFSLGATLYELLTLRPVIGVHGRAAAIQALKQLNVVPPRVLDRRIPQPLEQIVLKCLQRQPSDRYATAAELADDLQRFLDRRPIAARPLGLVHRGMRWARRHPQVSLSVVVVIAICLLLSAIVSSIAQHRGQVASIPRGPPGEEVVDTSPDASPPFNSNSDPESPDMLRADRAKRFGQSPTNRKPIRRPLVERLEDRRLLALPPEISIADGFANEGESSEYRFVDAYVTSQSGGLSNPLNSDFGPDGNLYVASKGTNSVLRYDGTSGAFIDEFVSPGSGGLDEPRDLVFDTNGNLLVTSRNTNQVIRYNGADGTFDMVLVNGGGLNVPQHMVYNAVTDELFVSSAQSDEVFRYDGLTGDLIDTFVTAGSGGLSNPKGLALTETGGLLVVSQLGDQILEYDSSGSFERIFFSVPITEASTAILTELAWGTDGNLLVSEDNDLHGGRVIRLNADSGAMMGLVVAPGSGGLDGVRGITLDGDGNLYVASFNSHEIQRYAPASIAALNVNLSSAATTLVTVDFSTGSGSAIAGDDFISISGTLTFAPGQTMRTVFVPTLDDAVYEGNETFVVNLSNPVGASIADGQGVATIQDNELPPAKFYVVDDGSANRTYEYGPTGSAVENYSLNSGNAAPRGAASTAAGDRVWVVDANRKVYVYDPSGGLLGSWTAGTLASNATVEGIATNGTDVWIVDAKSDKVFRYTGAASRLSGSQNAASSFSLNSGNRDPKDLVTDGSSLWVVNNNSTDKVFKYTVAGGLVGSWTIGGGGGSPTGITIDPSNVSDIWIVDSSADKVFQYTAAASRTSGSQSASASFALAAGNTNPQGIADPPPPGALEIASLDTASRVSPEAADMAIGRLIDESPRRSSSRSTRVEQSIHQSPRSSSVPAEFISGQAHVQISSAGQGSSTARRPIDVIDDLFTSWDQDVLVGDL